MFQIYKIRYLTYAHGTHTVQTRINICSSLLRISVPLPPKKLKNMVSEKIKITVRNSSLVYPSEPTPLKKLWNSNLDLVVGKIHFPTVYFYKPNGACNFFDSEILRQSLSNVLVSFFPMAGRLSKNEKGRVEIDCNAQGALFVEAEADSSVDDFGDFRPSPQLRRLVPVADYSGDISSYPLVMAQVHALIYVCSSSFCYALNIRIRS